MYYLLDNKTNLGSIIVPVGTKGTITVYNDFSVIPSNTLTPSLSVSNTGSIIIGSTTTQNNININSGINFGFSEINGTDTNYTLSQNDYSIDVVSNTYNTVTLPLAQGIGGRTYIIGRSSTNNNLTVVCHLNDTIDLDPSILLARQYNHIKVMSNNENIWYVI